MTDKPTIIDGVDVSECVNFRDDVYTNKQINNACSIGLWQRHYSGLEENCKMSCECKNNPNCDYKRYKQAEQKLGSIKERVARVSYLDPQSTRLLRFDIENIIGDKTNE